MIDIPRIRTFATALNVLWGPLKSQECQEIWEEGFKVDPAEARFQNVQASRC